MAKTITSANSQYILAIPLLFPAPQQLQGYAADAAFDTAEVDEAEVVMGVDGRMSAGFVPFITPQVIHLQADSPSIALFESWLAAEKAIMEKYYASGIIVLPSVQRKYVCTNGVLRAVSQVPSAKKVLQPRDFTINWEDISPVPFTS